LTKRSRIAAAALVWVATAATAPGTADDTRLAVPFAIDATRSDPARPTRPLGERYKGPVFDTHTHLFPVHDLKVVTEAMDLAQVGRLVLLPTPNSGRAPGTSTILGQMDLLRRNSKGAVLVMCGSDYLTPWMQSAAELGSVPDDIDRQMARLARDLKSGACAGVGEIGFRHYDKTGQQLAIDLPAGYPPLLAIAETAAKSNAPLDLHAEPAEPRGTRHDAEVFGTIGAMFARSPNLRLIGSHTAMTNARNARALLAAFPTLTMNVNFGKHTSSVDWRNLEGVTDDRRQLYADWAALFEEMPDRFMVGTDFFFGRGGDVPKEYERRIRHVRRVLGSLDPVAARRIAFENAARVFGQQPR
jgi:hypothetical protein